MQNSLDVDECECVLMNALSVFFDVKPVLEGFIKDIDLYAVLAVVCMLNKLHFKPFFQKKVLNQKCWFIVNNCL